jgi:hypothetical protein
LPSGEDVDLPVWLESLAAAAEKDGAVFGDAASFDELRRWFIRVDVGSWCAPSP